MKKERIFADIIDLFLVIVIGITLSFYLSDFIDSFLKSSNAIFIVGVLSPLFCIIAFDSFFNCLFFASPGKWLYNLKITTRYNVNPLKKTMLLRGVLKTITLITFVGAIITIISISENRNSWYDDVLDLKLVFK
ncbi:MAG: RDD family protein [Bacteroidia bacterium]